jgi:beta-N-acetylhexosaminidase
MPGCVVLAAYKGNIIYHEAFGYANYDSLEPITLNHVYDLASVTKITATTLAVMKLYEEGKLDLKKTIGDYLGWTQNTNKAAIKIEDLLLHQAGLNPFIPFYKETIDTSTGKPLTSIYANKENATYNTRVAEKLYLHKDWKDTMYVRILNSALSESGKYVYSDNDFIFLGKIVEAITGKALNTYLYETFYAPMQMSSTKFTPRKHMPVQEIVPTEFEKQFRQQLIRGDVHDEGAAMFGGVSGHAGLFSNAYDLLQPYQMLLNKGELNNHRYLQPSTIALFTGYNSTVSRRGLGFDKPEKDNESRKEPYPSKYASSATYGHTGFTGTCVWVDPDASLVYIFLANRVTPSRSNTIFGKLGVRPQIQEAIYNALRKLK